MFQTVEIYPVVFGEREGERERVRLSIASLVSLEREVVTWNQLQGPGEWQYILGKEPFGWQVGR